MLSACDSAGNLLFYTNGIYIADSLDDMMENGDSLNPGEMADDWAIDGYPVVQSEIVLPMPGLSGLFSLFHLKLDYHPTLILARTTLFNTIIDINLNNGLGKVIEKNTVLLTGNNLNLGRITAVKHGNGQDWWIIVSENKTNKYYKFLLGKNFLDGPFGQNVQPQYGENNNGSIVVSPDGELLVKYELSHGIYINSFDRCTGNIELMEFLPISLGSLGGGLSISPNSRFMYVTTTTEIHQYDLWASNIAASKTTVAVYDGYQSPFGSTFHLSQLGPDGRIYLNCTNGENVLHVINRPNFPGDSCGMAQHGVQLLSYNSFTMPHFPNYRLGPIDGSPCDTLGLDNHPLAKWRHDTLGLTATFTDNSFYEPTDWLWDFGDGGSSVEINPVHGFAGPGTYMVCLTVSNQYGSDTMCRPLAVDGPVAVSEQAKWPHFVVYPNPASTEIHFSFKPTSHQKARLSLFDSTGQKIRDWKVLPGQEVQSYLLDGFASGLYFWKVEMENGKSHSGKLVIAK